LCYITGASAQTQKGSHELHGTVVDETGAFIVGAKVSLDNGKGRRYDIETDNTGKYRFTEIEPGNNTLTISADGFADLSELLDLTSRSIPALITTLKVQINEELEVRPDTPSISVEPDKNLSAITITGQELEALPDDPDELLETLREMAGP